MFLHSMCDSCNAALSIFHSLDCKKGDLITTSSTMGLPTSQANPLTPHMWATIPSSIQVVKCGRERPILHDYFSTIHPCLSRYLIRREKCWSANSCREVRTLLTACVLWILMPFPTRTSLQRSVFRRNRSRIRRIIWSLVFGNVTISSPVSYLRMASLEWRQRLRLNAQPAASRRNWNIPTLRRAPA